MKRSFIITCILIISGAIANAQTPKSTEKVNQVWLAYFNQVRFHDKWGVWFDAHLRTKEEFVQDLAQAIGRVGLTYYFDDATKITSGYAFINHFPSDNHKNISQPEHRAWQQLQWHTKYGRKRMMQWFRLEERFRRKILNDSTLANGHTFNYRLRYNFFYDIPLSSAGIQKGKPSFVINNEVHVNFGKQIVNNYFDQNRFFVGMKYQVSDHDNVQLGYMNVFQQLAAGNRYRSTHVIRLFYFQNLDLRRKSEGER